MAITQDILTVYSALAEHIYRRDSNYDQSLKITDIAQVLGLQTLPVVTGSGLHNCIIDRVTHCIRVRLA